MWGDRVVCSLLVRNSLECREGFQMSDHPKMQFLHIRYSVNDSAWPKDICVFCEKRWSRGISLNQRLEPEFVGVKTYEIILALCFRALKCGSGNKKKILLSYVPVIVNLAFQCGQMDNRRTWSLTKKFGKNFIALARTTLTFWYPPSTNSAGLLSSVLVSCASNRACASMDCWRKAAIRSVTYCVTWTRISMPWRTKELEMKSRGNMRGRTKHECFWIHRSQCDE
jgi:hypothetical protein